MPDMLCNFRWRRWQEKSEDHQWIRKYWWWMWRKRYKFCENIRPRDWEGVWPAITSSSCFLQEQIPADIHRYFQCDEQHPKIYHFTWKCVSTYYILCVSLSIQYLIMPLEKRGYCWDSVSQVIEFCGPNIILVKIGHHGLPVYMKAQIYS